MLPATAHITHGYTVIGDTTIAGVLLLQVHRADSITAAGEGSSGQHRVVIAARGTGSVEEFLDTVSGHLVKLDGDQSTTLDVMTSGRLEHYVQHVKQTVVLLGTP